jgi:hypothetical protein
VRDIRYLHVFREGESGQGGFVTLPLDEREASRPEELSCRCDGGSPRVHRGRAKRAVRLGRCEMALDVKGVVDGERNFWAEPGLLNRCILRSRRRVG